MAQFLNLPLCSLSSTRPNSSDLQPLSSARFYRDINRSFQRGSQHKFTCHFSDNRNRREEQARKALESALGGKKNEFAKWDKEIKRRGEAGGGGGSGGGSWFGSGGRFGWSNGDRFWQGAQLTSLIVLGIILLYLIVAKGELLLAIIANPLLYLQGARDGLASFASRIMEKSHGDKSGNLSNEEEYYRPVSAKERVLRKWGSA